MFAVFVEAMIVSQFFLDKYGTQVCKCPMCGQYRIDDLEAVDINKSIIAGYLFDIKDAMDSDDYYSLTRTNIDAILTSPLVPKSISEKITKLLEYVNIHTTYFGEEVDVPLQAAYLINSAELENIILALEKEELICNPYLMDEASGYTISLTMKGIEYVEKHKSEIKKSQCFVAMWYDKVTDDLWNKAIRPACLNAGYNPVRIDKVPHNNNIADEILAEIRKSHFLIADFTGQNRGVYYEAGFARSLGKQVIQLCRDDYFDGADNEHRMHFDNIQINTLKWQKGNEEALSEDIQF